MALGAGKYDNALAIAMKEASAGAGLLIVLSGKLGHGFSCHATIEQLTTLPAILRSVADQLEQDIPATLAGVAGELAGHPGRVQPPGQDRDPDR